MTGEPDLAADVGMANQAAAVDGGIRARFHVKRAWPAATELYVRRKKLFPYDAAGSNW